MEEKKTSQEWEIGVMEQLAQSDELQLLDLAQDLAIRLAAELADGKGALRLGRKISRQEKDMLRLRIGRMAVLLDVLQLRYGDSSFEELLYLDSIEDCLQAEE